MPNPLRDLRVSKQDSDQELMARFYRNDDDSALETFVRRHQEWALRKARQYSSSEAEDIVQISILRLMDSQPVNGKVSSPLGWWNTIIGAVAVDLLRKSAAHRRKESRCSEIGDLGETSTSAEDSTIRNQLIGLVRHEIGKLDHRFRETLLKRYFDDLSYSQISNILRISPGTVASRLARSIAHIRDSLVQQGVLDLAYTSNAFGDKTTMTIEDTKLIENNKSFVEKWREIWTISDGRGLGRFKTQLNDDGSVEVNWRLDIPMTNAPYRPENAESAESRLWFENILTLRDTRSFKWTRYRSREGATGEAYTKMLERGMLYDGDQTIEFLNDDQLAVQSNGEQVAIVDVPSRDPVVPDVLLLLLVCEFSPDRETSWPINLLVFERLSNGKKWDIAHTRGVYSGRKGLPTGLSHAFEIEMRPYTGRDMSIWVTDDGHLIGLGDERESFVVGGDEVSTRSILKRQTPLS